MLPGAPWLLAHKSMLPVNRPQKFSLYGQDYVVWKDSSGKVSALPNTCPHLGAMLSEGWCEADADGGSAVVCPFHALSFDREGRTILPDRRDRKTLPQVEPLELIEQGDLIWTYGGCEPLRPKSNLLASSGTAGVDRTRRFDLDLWRLRAAAAQIKSPCLKWNRWS